MSIGLIFMHSPNMTDLTDELSKSLFNQIIYLGQCVCIIWYCL